MKSAQGRGRTLDEGVDAALIVGRLKFAALSGAAVLLASGVWAAIPPHVLQISPEDGAVGVALEAEIHVLLQTADQAYGLELFEADTKKLGHLHRVAAAESAPPQDRLHIEVRYARVLGDVHDRIDTSQAACPFIEPSTRELTRGLDAIEGSRETRVDGSTRGRRPPRSTARSRQREVGSSGRIRTENPPSTPADPEQLELDLKRT
jgi:hypothetical protein